MSSLLFSEHTLLFQFQQDNAHPHTNTILKACLKDTDTIPWPDTSPDLSLIENVWDAIVNTTNRVKSAGSE
uniref:Tc1-like transposase DDE domain-containing protein n=1 Tax=Astyanax mexicanus TaxID=7994 RepID=A0A8B9KGI7_ASTMX